MPKQYPTRASLHRPLAGPAAGRSEPEATPTTRLPQTPARTQAPAAAAPVPHTWFAQTSSVTPDARVNPTATRAERRATQRGERGHRRAQLTRLTHTGSLAAVASALIMATVVADQAAGTPPAPAGAAEGQPTPFGADLSALAQRTLATARSGERTPLALDAGQAGEPGDPIAAAAGALERAAELIATESRATPVKREQVMVASAVVRELVHRANVGESPAPADPGLAATVDSLLEDTAAGHVAGDALWADEAIASLTMVEAPAPPDTADPLVLTTALARATADLKSLLNDAAPAAVDVAPAPLTPEAVLTRQIAEAQADAARLSQYADITRGHANGRLPAETLRDLSWAAGHRLRPDAAAQLERLNIAFRARFGDDLQITDSYRSFEGQVRARALRGRLAATPGTSNHGWGVAVDLGSGVNRFGTATHRWMRENAPSFGWDLPGWARENGSKPEPWHWEFEGAPESFAD
ncbi:M15 family metallopeptidase [Xylanimonas ulmi]|uniref:D-alanyl-D-alanine carboxypeptidase-like protein n=1 Tax=Xylanimonas ulmi TaxID=228973 RepID=A0A4Q7M0U3_9MICO|nr:M15 family metallopeptidase [Xylanibacterium ulmi]RZS60994.1 D-alanyl-D-alanine carboxypeptidase-like protein [Xylanibacterium ulmi]